MSLESAFRTYLLSSPELTDKIGTGRFYRVARPQVTGTTPCVVYERMSTQREYEARISAGLPQASFQLRLWGGEGAGGFDIADAIGEIIRPLLDGFKGKWTDGTASYDIDLVRIMDEKDLYMDPEFAAETSDLRGKVYDLMIDFKETVRDFTSL